MVIEKGSTRNVTSSIWTGVEMSAVVLQRIVLLKKIEYEYNSLCT